MSKRPLDCCSLGHSILGDCWGNAPLSKGSPAAVGEMSSPRDGSDDLKLAQRSLGLGTEWDLSDTKMGRTGGQHGSTNGR